MPRAIKVEYELASSNCSAEIYLFFLSQYYTRIFKLTKLKDWVRYNLNLLRPNVYPSATPQKKSILITMTLIHVCLIY